MQDSSLMLPFVCPVCIEDRVAFAAEPGIVSFLAYCQTCGYRVLFSWCPSCGAGGPAPLAPGEEPAYQTCPICRKPYVIPAAVYNRPQAAPPAAEHAGPTELGRWFLKVAAALAGILLAAYILIRLA